MYMVGCCAPLRMDLALKNKLTAFVSAFAVASALFVSAAFAADLESKTVSNFTPGLQTTQDSIYIEDGAAQDLQNVDVSDGRIQTRRGSTLQNSTALGSYSSEAVRFLHEFPDANGNTWLISLSSSSLFKSRDAGATQSVLTSTHGLTANSVVSAVNAFGKCRLTDGTTNWILFDGDVVSVSTASLKGKLSVFWLGRIWTADIVGDRSTLYGARQNDPEDWTDDGLTDADMYSIPIREDDGYPITALAQYRTMLVIFKAFSIDLLTSADGGLTFTLTPISLGKGTQHPRSIQIVRGKLIFMADDGWYEFDGVNLTKISDTIDPTFFSIQQVSASQQNYTETTQEDFLAGSRTNTSADITPGSVVLSSAVVFSQTDNSAAEFALGSLMNATTWFSPGFVYFAPALNAGFEDNAATAEYGWKSRSVFTGSTSTFAGYSGNARTGTYAARMDSYNDPIAPCDDIRIGTYYLIVHSTGYAVLEQSSLYSTSDSGWVQKSFDLSAYAGTYIKLKFKPITPPNPDIEIFSEHPFYCIGGTLTWYDYTYTTTGGACETNHFLIDDVGGSAVYSSGTFVSKSFDTGVSSPSWSVTTHSVNDYGNRVVARTQSSSDGLAWGSSMTWTSGTSPKSDFARYIRYQVDFSTSVGGYYVAWLSEANLSARVATGTYLSPAVPTSGITTWNSFTGGSSVVGGGSHVFSIYTDSDTATTPSNPLTYTSSQTITNGVIPTLTGSNYARVGSAFAVTSDTQTPTMTNFTLSWNVGSSFPVASVEHEGSYITAVAIDSSTVNDTMMVYDENGAWTKYKGMTAYSMTKYRQKPYYGSSYQGSIYRFQVDDIYTDNSLPIDAYWMSKDFDFGYPITDKTMMRYRLTARHQPGTSLTFQYGVNKPTAYASETLDLGSGTGFYRKNIVPSSLTYQKGVTHRIKFSNNASNQPFDILSFTLVPRLETAP